MTAIINLTVAAFLSFKAVSCLRSPSRFFSRQELFFLFILLTGLFHTGGATIAGLNLSAWRLLLWILFTLYALLALKNRQSHRKSAFDFPVVCYSLFLLWNLFHLFFYSPDILYGIRTLLKLIYPFLILILARRVTVIEKVPVYLHLTFYTTLIISFFNSGISEHIPYLAYNPLLREVLWGRSTFADHAAIMVGVGLALWSSNLAGKPLLNPIIIPTHKIRHRKKKVQRFFKSWQYKAALLWLCISPMAVANRTGLLATAGSIATFLVYRYKLRSIPSVLFIFLFGLWIILYMPSFRDSTFRGRQDITMQNIQQLSSSAIDSSGRFAMWEHLMDRFYTPDKIKGAGLGTTQQYMYTMASIPGGGPFGVIKAPHSDYVVLLCDLGLIGFSLYMLTGISALFIGFTAVFKKTQQERMLGLVVASSFVALFCAMGFDNPHLYALGVHQYPFAFLGMLLAVRSKPKIKHHSS